MRKNVLQAGLHKHFSVFRDIGRCDKAERLLKRELSDFITEGAGGKKKTDLGTLQGRFQKTFCRLLFWRCLDVYPAHRHRPDLLAHLRSHRIQECAAGAERLLRPVAGSGYCPVVLLLRSLKLLNRMPSGIQLPGKKSSI